MMKKNDCILWTYVAGKVWKKCTQVRDLEKRVADARGFLELADRVLTGEDNDSVGDLSQVPMENLLAALEQSQKRVAELEKVLVFNKSHAGDFRIFSDCNSRNCMALQAIHRDCIDALSPDKKGSE